MPKNFGFAVSTAKCARECPGIPGLSRETRTLRNCRDCVADAAVGANPSPHPKTGKIQRKTPFFGLLGPFRAVCSRESARLFKGLEYFPPFLVTGNLLPPISICGQPAQNVHRGTKSVGSSAVLPTGFPSCAASCDRKSHVTENVRHRNESETHPRKSQHPPMPDEIGSRRALRPSGTVSSNNIQITRQTPIPASWSRRGR